MFDKEKIDQYFADNTSFAKPKLKEQNKVTKRTKIVRLFRLLLPSIAAVLIGVLLVFPSLKKDVRDFKLDITMPKKGELEKLHVENTVLYITDSKNQVNNFTAQSIDETAPGSKLVKLHNPEGMMPLSKENWINIKSPTGYFNQNTNIIQLTEDVKMYYNEGMEVETQELFYDFNSRKGYGNQPVAAEGIFGNLLAEGFIFDSDNQILTFTGHSDITVHEESFKEK